MPTFPTYESSGNIQTPPGPERHQAAQAFEDVQKMLGTLQGITEHFSKAHDVMQETKAKAYYMAAFAQQEQAATNDPNADNAEFHLKAVQDIQKNVPKIDNAEVANLVNLDMQQESLLTGIKIQDAFKKKQMFANDLRLDSLATTAAQNVATAVSPAQAQQDEDNFMQTIRDNANAGLITPERELSLVRSFKVGVARNKILSNPSTNAEDFKGVTDGLDLDMKEAEAVQKMIDAKVKQNIQVDVQKTFRNRTEVLKGISSGDLSWQSPDYINKISKTDPKLGEALQAVFDADAKGVQYAPESDQNLNFANMVNQLFKSKTKEDVNDFLLKICNSTASRNMSRDRLSILVNAAEQQGASLSTNKESGDGQENSHQKSVEINVKHIQEHIKDNPKSNNVFVDFFKELLGGGDPSRAKDTAIKNDNLQKYPWLGNVPDEGLSGYDKITGAKIRVFKDGSIKTEK